MTTSSYCVYDLETTVNGTGKFKASAFDPVNKIVLAAWKYQNKPEAGITRYNHDMPPFAIGNKCVLVGHNIKFDLHHTRKAIDNDTEYFNWLNEWYMVWDTQLAQYLITAQTMTFPSLDETAAYWGLGAKLDEVKKLWEAGVKTEDIDPELLDNYAKQDVLLTEQVYLKQREWLDKHADMYMLVYTQMRALLATCDMEYNGMHIHKKSLKVFEAVAKSKLEAAVRDMNANQERIIDALGIDTKHEELLKRSADDVKDISIDMLQPQQSGAIVDFLNDGAYKLTYQEAKRFKTSTRVQWVSRTLKCKTNLPLSSLTGKTVKSSDDEALTEYCRTKSTISPPERFATAILQGRKYAKLLGTYIVGLAECIFPDECIHPNINHAGTATGRLSSSNPNSQNFPSGDDSPIKACFQSRYYSGYIVEFDFKQLEIIGLAHLSGDKQLVEDINNGTDIHMVTAERVWGVGKVSKEQRRIAKVINFGLAYGGGAATLAAQSGADINIVKKCIEAFYSRYPQVKKWQQEYRNEVERNAVWSSDVSKLGVPIQKSVMVAPTGRRLAFKQYDSPDFLRARGIMVGFSPTETANYPVQSFSTADIVPLVLGEIYEQLFLKGDYNRQNIKIINTIHDSFMFDVPDMAAVEQVKKDVIKIVESTPQLLEQWFGIQFDLPMRCDFAYGTDWNSTK